MYFDWEAKVVIQDFSGKRREKALLVGISFCKKPALDSCISAASKATSKRYRAPGTLLFFLIRYLLRLRCPQQQKWRAEQYRQKRQISTA